MNAHSHPVSTRLHWCPKCQELDEPIVYAADDIHGELIGVITNALNGHAVGTFKSGGSTFEVHLGVPLCPYCEEPIEEPIPLTDVIRVGNGVAV